MSEGRPVIEKPTIEQLKGYFKEVHDELTRYIGMMDAAKVAYTSPIEQTESAWNSYLLDHIRKLYDLMEETILYLKANQDSLDKMPKTFADFEKRKPILDFIAETEMTGNSQVQSKDDE